MLNHGVISQPSLWRINGVQKVGGNNGWDDDVRSLSAITADSNATAAYKNGVAVPL